MIAVVPPRTKAELLSELARVHESCATYWRSFPADSFWRRLGEAWSPADNARHLLKSTRPVARALGLPRPLLLLLFGLSGRESRPYEGLVETYRGVLSRGGEAGRFAPTPRPVPEDPSAGREELLAQSADAHRRLLASADRWSERSLDRYRLPHPLLGKLTVREMLFFTLYHHVHHVENVVRRSGRPT